MNNHSHFQHAFASGLRDAAQLQLALPLYILGLVLGLIQTWPVLLGVSSGQLERVNLERALRGGDALFDLVAQADVLSVIAIWAVLLPLLNIVYSLAYNFFSGGILGVWSGTQHFWAGCRHFFFGFCGLGILLVVIGMVVIGVAAVVGASFNQAIVVAIIGAIALQLLNLVGEYARAIAVTQNWRNPFTVFGAAVTFCARCPGALVLGLIGLLAHVALAAAYLGLVNLLGTSLLVILLNQALILGWLWIKLLRLAWARRYVAAQEQRQFTTLLDNNTVF